MNKTHRSYIILKRIDDKLRVLGKLLVSNESIDFGVVNEGLDYDKCILKEELVKFKKGNDPKLSIPEQIDAATKYLQKLNYIVELEPESSQIKIQGTYENGSNFAQKKSGTQSAYHQDIEQSIQKILSSIPRTMAKDAYTKFHKAFQEKNYHKTVDILYENTPGFLDYSNSEKKIIAESLQTILAQKSTRKNEKAFKLLMAFDEGLYNIHPDFIEQLRNQYEELLSVEERSAMDVYLAYNYKKQNYRTKAYLKFKYIIEHFDVPKARARAYLGLSRVCDKSDPDRVELLTKAADTFRQSGELAIASQCHTEIAKLKSKISLSEALEHLDLSVKLAGGNKENFSIIKLQMLVNAASQHVSLAQHQIALDQLLPVIEQYMGVYGAEYPLANAINIAITVAKFLELDKCVDELNEKLIKVEENIQNDDYFFKKKITNCISSNDEEQLKSFELECENKPKELSLLKILIGNNKNQSFTKAVDYLDEAKSIAEKYNLEDVIEIASISLANIFSKNEHYDEALKIYLAVLNSNPFNYTARQNTLALLFQKEDWEDAITILEKEIDLFGELPNILFLYGKALCKVNDKKAYGVLVKAKGATDSETLHEKIDELIAELPLELLNNESCVANIIKPFSLQSFEKALDELSVFIANDKRMSFWSLDKITKKHKWKSQPERLAQDLTHTFLKSKFGDQIKIFEEVGTGAGRIDIFLQLSSKLEVVLELKMCGGGYSSTYAKGGIPQIVHYMKSKRTHIGYLLVFDSRIRDHGKSFHDIIEHKTYCVSPIIVDVRSSVESQ